MKASSAAPEGDIDLSEFDTDTPAQMNTPVPQGGKVEPVSHDGPDAVIMQGQTSTPLTQAAVPYFQFERAENGLYLQTVNGIQNWYDVTGKLIRSEPVQPTPAPSTEQTKEDRLFSLLMSDRFTGAHYLDAEPPKRDWVFVDGETGKGIIPLGRVFMLAAYGGTGKGLLSNLMIAAIAGGGPFLWMRPAVIGKAVYLSTEDDAVTLHHRCRDALFHLYPDEQQRRAAAENFRSVPLPPSFLLMGTDSQTGRAKKITACINAVERALVTEKPKLLVLDTLSSMTNMNENDNPTMQAANKMLDEMGQAYGCAIGVNHHVRKPSGGIELVMDAKEEAYALSSTAIRGAGSIVNGIRLAISAAPLHHSRAAKAVNDPSAIDREDGHYVAIKISKSNVCSLGYTHYIQKVPVGEHGYQFQLVEANPDRDKNTSTRTRVTIPEAADKLLEAVKKNAEIRKVEPERLPYGASANGVQGADTGIARGSELAVMEMAIQRGDLIAAVLPEAERKRVHGTRGKKYLWLKGAPELKQIALEAEGGDGGKTNRPLRPQKLSAPSAETV